MSSLAFRYDLAQVSRCDADEQCFLDNKHGLHLYMFESYRQKNRDTEREREREVCRGRRGQRS